MAEPRQLPRPVVRAAARLHADQARRQLREKCQHALALQLPLHGHLACRIHPVHLEHALGEINPDRANLHVDGPLM